MEAACVLCLLRDDDAATGWACGHVLHHTCLAAWLSQYGDGPDGGGCPVCHIAAPRPRATVAGMDELDGVVTLPRCLPGHPASSVIFLDVDGVLNSHAGAPEPGPLTQLRRLLAATGSGIVLCSDWRRKDHLTQELRRAFHEAGIPGDPIIGRTPGLHRATRPEEIRSWLDEHGSELGRGWVAIDDGPLEAIDGPGGRLRGRCVQTDAAVGLTAADADLAIARIQEASAPTSRAA
mmetsp:Transcript_87222/g.244764  ORF Transcript_87222/g.244764 Transcript_87222/m.244764 type:complete len:235 (+) Transcript_87222:43-747(+)